MNMFLHELKAYRKSTVIWTLSLVALVVLFLSMFPSFSKDAEEFKSLLKGFPVELRKAIGLSVDSIATLIGFFSYAFLYLKLAGAIQAMNLGTSILSKETREKTADFLLTKPVTRAQVVTSKLLAALVSLFITNIVFIAAALVMASIVSVDDFNKEALFLIAVSLFFLQLMFLALGIVISAIFPRIKSVISVSLGTVFGFFMLGMISSTTEDEALRYLTPFNYFDSAYITQHASYETSFLLTAAILIIAAIVASYYLYSKKDVHSV
ncbi:ABC transporter permease subunit [Bacillus sp. ISL-35]|uniref:ABC transporter permease subunit n=1 Tax=Bacillus sp. ISL-35 TaxID=2819122 RepID=UPI001BE7624B|nr:ABC transporter permease subunit [Bacillus sp. ISL-35]MBT2679955.1 ABC transporter permease subunit [Bacillus sp. ISL-35]MBT2703070.1 ABC transporter permease subunit [Chryseobacterium sp. ISL-80]